MDSDFSAWGVARFADDTSQKGLGPLKFLRIEDEARLEGDDRISLGTNMVVVPRTISDRGVDTQKAGIGCDTSAELYKREHSRFSKFVVSGAQVTLIPLTVIGR